MASLDSINFNNSDYLITGANTLITCSTGATTQAKTATVPKGFSLDSTFTFFIKFTNGNTHSTPTLNLTPENGTALGAKNLVGVSGNTLLSDVIYICYYNGTSFTIDNRCTAHISNTSNPHSVTKTQVGLGNVQNLAMDTYLTTYSHNYVENAAITNMLNYAICSTARNTANKTVDIYGFQQYEGVTIRVCFSNGNGASNPTLSVNNGTAYPIYRHYEDLSLNFGTNSGATLMYRYGKPYPEHTTPIYHWLVLEL